MEWKPSNKLSYESFGSLIKLINIKAIKTYIKWYISTRILNDDKWWSGIATAVGESNKKQNFHYKYNNIMQDI